MKFSPSSLDDINDLDIEIDYASKEAIDWAQVDLKKATKSDTFDMALLIGQN